MACVFFGGEHVSTQREGTLPRSFLDEIRLRCVEENTAPVEERLVIDFATKQLVEQTTQPRKELAGEARRRLNGFDAFEVEVNDGFANEDFLTRLLILRGIVLPVGVHGVSTTDKGFKLGIVGVGQGVSLELLKKLRVGLAQLGKATMQKLMHDGFAQRRFLTTAMLRLEIDIVHQDNSFVGLRIVETFRIRFALDRLADIYEVTNVGDNLGDFVQHHGNRLHRTLAEFANLLSGGWRE